MGHMPARANPRIKGISPSWKSSRERERGWKRLVFVVVLAGLQTVIRVAPTTWGAPQQRQRRDQAKCRQAAVFAMSLCHDGLLAAGVGGLGQETPRITQLQIAQERVSVDTTSNQLPPNDKEPRNDDHWSGSHRHHRQVWNRG